MGLRKNNLNISTECITCIFNQSLRVANELGLDEVTTKKVLDESAKMIPSFSLSATPPQNATPMYEMISKLLDKKDLYNEAKIASIEKATTLIPKCQDILAQSDNKFLSATKIAVVGNVIDLASEIMFDLDEEVDKVMDNNFGIDDSPFLYHELTNAKKVVYLADNAGENVFDRLYIEYLKNEFKDIEFFYFVRGNPIINDITVADLEGDEIHKSATVIDSGVPTPGIVIDLMNNRAKELFESADLIISKGMGNFECLNGETSYPIFFLLKIKCNVVASALNEKIGGIICKRV